MENLNMLENSSILATKLLPPDLPEGLVRRSELLASLEKGLQNYRLILLSAPAGSGKTTLAAQWCNEYRLGTAEGRVAWLVLDSEDNNWRGFWQYFIAACHKIWPETRFSAQELLIKGKPEIEILTVFLNELAGLPGSGVLVLEDFHRVVSLEIHRSLKFLIERLPRQLRILILTRLDPALPLAGEWRP